MNTTVEYIQEYLKNNYDLDFIIEKYGTQRELQYKNGKKEYSLSCGYAQSNRLVDDAEYWSIYHNFMDYKEWYGYGGAEVDNGNKTIDEIMKEWGFNKTQQQMTIFDFIEEE